MLFWGFGFGLGGPSKHEGGPRERSGLEYREEVDFGVSFANKEKEWVAFVFFPFIVIRSRHLLPHHLRTTPPPSFNIFFRLIFQSNPHSRFLLQFKAPPFLYRSQSLSSSSLHRHPQTPLLFKIFEYPEISLVLIDLILTSQQLLYTWVSLLLQTAFDSVPVYLVFEKTF